MASRRLVIFGASGFGAEALWVAERLSAISKDLEILGFCDDNQQKRGTQFSGRQVIGDLGDLKKLSPEPGFFHCAIGNNRARKLVAARLAEAGWRPMTLIDPSVIVAPNATVGDGAYVGAGSIVSPHSRIGNHVLINHHCSIGHDSNLGDYAQIAPGGRISGNVRVGEGAFVATNAVIAPGKSLGEWSTLGACSFASRNIESHTVAIGVPAKKLMRTAEGKSNDA